MPTALPIPTKNPGDVLTSTLWNSFLRDNLNKLLNLGHRTLTVAQFAAITTPEGTKGVVAGDEVYLEVDATNGVLWHLVYESTETTYKWRFLGGPPLVAVVATSESTSTSGSWVDLATVGPQIIVPRAGDYVAKTFVIEAFGSANYTVSTGVAQGAGTPATNTADGNPAASAVNRTVVGHFYPSSDTNLAGVPASTNLRLRYQINSVVSTIFLNRRLEILPNRII